MAFRKRPVSEPPKNAYIEMYAWQVGRNKELEAELQSLRAEKADRERADAQAKREAWLESDPLTVNYTAAIATQSARLLASSSNNVMVAVDAIERLTEARDQHIANNAPKVPGYLDNVNFSAGACDKIAYDWLRRQGINPYPGEPWHL